MCVSRRGRVVPHWFPFIIHCRKYTDTTCNNLYKCQPLPPAPPPPPPPPPAPPPPDVAYSPSSQLHVSSRHLSILLNQLLRFNTPDIYTDCVVVDCRCWPGVGRGSAGARRGSAGLGGTRRGSAGSDGNSVADLPIGRAAQDAALGVERMA